MSKIAYHDYKDCIVKHDKDVPRILPRPHFYGWKNAFSEILELEKNKSNKYKYILKFRTDVLLLNNFPEYYEDYLGIDYNDKIVLSGERNDPKGGHGWTTDWSALITRPAAEAYLVRCYYDRLYGGINCFINSPWQLVSDEQSLSRTLNNNFVKQGVLNFGEKLIRTSLYDKWCGKPPTHLNDHINNNKDKNVEIIIKPCRCTCSVVPQCSYEGILKRIKRKYSKFNNL